VAETPSAAVHGPGVRIPVDLGGMFTPRGRPAIATEQLAELVTIEKKINTLHY